MSAADAPLRTVELPSGLRMQIAVYGEGPLVILLHGFPELWYSWRHQLPALAAAGYRVVAPNQRGYAGTDAPESIDAYSRLQLVGDLIGLVKVLGEQTATLVGHDWGAAVTQWAGLLRPDVFTAIGLLSVPFLPREERRPFDPIRAMAGDQWFYQVYFQEPGVAEAELERDVRRTMQTFAWLASASLPRERRFKALFPRGTGMLDGYDVPSEVPPWTSAGDLDVFVEAFEFSGFRGPLNFYRNIEPDWERTPFLAGATLRQPVTFIAGAEDAVLTFYPQAVEHMERFVPGLRSKTLIPGAGHWVQQEKPEEVTELLLEFLRGL